MKRVRIEIETETRRPRNSKGFTYKARSTPETRRLDRLRIEATTPADSYLTRLMNEAATARRLARDAKAYETDCWAKLSRYLLDGTRDDGKKPRIRIVGLQRFDSTHYG